MEAVHPTHTPPPALVAATVAVNAANEGIPVAAIGRILNTPFGDILETLREQKDLGRLIDMPRSDWPPGTRVADRLPALSLPNDDDLSFMCKKTYKLTGLEASFLVVLLKHKHVEKTRLHNIVENQRAMRATQPNNKDATDPKMVDVMICKLRKKLKVIDKDLKIETIWGGGYYIEAAMKPRIVAYADGDQNASKEAITADAPARGRSHPAGVSPDGGATLRH